MSDEKELKRKLTLKEAAEQAANAEKRLKEAKLKLAQAKRAVRKQQSNEKRAKETRLKMHAGGFLDMTGMLHYQYPEKSLYDNEQDALMAYLLVGKLLEAAKELEEANIDEIKRLYAVGKTFRDCDKASREVPGVNPRLQELFDALKSNQ